LTETVSIPGRDMVSLLHSEARKKPAIAALIEQAAGMSEAEIDRLKTPLPWYRKALKMIHHNHFVAQTMAQAAADLEGHVVTGFVGDPKGTMRVYSGESKFIKIDRGNLLQVECNTLIWFPFTGGVWIDSLFSSVIDPELGQSTSVSEVTKTEYTKSVRDRRNKIETGNVPYTVVEGAINAPQHRGFTIFR
jgi:hypothetical protein